MEEEDGGPQIFPPPASLPSRNPKINNAPLTGKLRPCQTWVMPASCVCLHAPPCPFSVVFPVPSDFYSVFSFKFFHVFGCGGGSDRALSHLIFFHVIPKWLIVNCFPYRCAGRKGWRESLPEH